MISRLWSETVFELSLRSRLRAGAFLGVVGLCGLWLAIATVNVATATALAQSTEISKLRRALALDPANPEAHHHLGLIYSYSLQDIDPAMALTHLRWATVLSPHNARYWIDLAEASRSTGNMATADIAVQRALELRPMTPRFRWKAANYYLQTDRPELAWPQFRRLLELSSEYAPATFQLCLGASGDPWFLFQRILPSGPDPKPKLLYVNFLSNRGEHEFAYRAWVQTVAKAPPFSLSLARPYVDRLLTLGRAREASQVWKDLERLGVVKRPLDADPENLLFNGDFEQRPLNTGFDWRSPKVPYLSVDFTDSVAYQGAACVRLDFTVKHNAEYEAPYQFVAVAPNQTYQVTAYARSEGITSDSGPRLRVLEPACPSCLDVSSEATVGTTGWHPLSLTFSTGPQARVVRLSVWRPRSRSFPTEISGGFWLDTVSIKPASECKLPISFPEL